MYIINKFSVCELTKTPSFIINRQFPFFGLNLPKKAIFGLKQKKANTSIKFTYLS